MLGIKTKLLELIRKKIYPFFGPGVVRIQPVGYKCNHNCPMCWRLQITNYDQFTKDPNNQDLSAADYKKLIKNLPFTVRHVEVVGGGEPLLFEGIAELLNDIKINNVYASLITNGVFLNKNISLCLIKSQWDLVRVSLNAGSRGIYRITNGVDDFTKVIENIKSFMRIRDDHSLPRVSLHYVIQKDNVADISNFVRLAKNLEVDEISLDTLLGFSPERVKLSHEDCEIAINQLKKNKHCFIKNNIDQVLLALNNKTMRESNYFEDKYCSIVQRNLDISGNGDVLPCCLSFGYYDALNIKNHSLSQIWKKYANFRRDLKKGNFKDFCYKNCTYNLPKKKSIR